MSLCRRVRLALVLLPACLLALPACESKPRAPALRDEPVYQNSQEGLRFLVPEGWTQFVSAEIPPGKLDQERMLAGWRRAAADKAASFEVSLIDLAADADLTTHLSRGSHGVSRWLPKGRPESLEINGHAATRTTLTGRAGKDDLTREVVAFRRGGRVYFFAGIYPPADGKARDEARRAASSVMWKD